MQIMDKSDKIFVAGHRGMVGSAVMRRLKTEAFSNVVTRERAQLDLTNESAVAKFFERERPHIVLVAAAKVGGIKANNDYPVEFLFENLRIQNNVIRSAYENGVRKLLFLGVPAFIQSSRRNRSWKARCSAGRWNRRMKLTQLRRLPASSFARHFLANTERTLSRRCRRISTGRTTISIWRLHTSWPRYCARRTKPKRETIASWWCGERENRAANFCMWTILPLHVFCFWRNMTRQRSSTSVVAKT